MHKWTPSLMTAYHAISHLLHAKLKETLVVSILILLDLFISQKYEKYLVTCDLLFNPNNTQDHCWTWGDYLGAQNLIGQSILHNYGQMSKVVILFELLSKNFSAVRNLYFLQHSVIWTELTRSCCTWGLHQALVYIQEKGTLRDTCYTLLKTAWWVYKEH